MSASFSRSRYAIAFLLAPLVCIGSTALAQPNTHSGAYGQSANASDPSVIVSDDSGGAPMADAPPREWMTGPPEGDGTVDGISSPNPGHCDYAPHDGYTGYGNYGGAPNCDPGPGDYCECPPARSPWYTVTELMILTRNNDSDDTIIVERDPFFEPEMGTGELDFSPEIGPRLVVGYNTCNSMAWEASYFGIYGWEDDETETGNNDLNLPGDLGLAANLDFFNADEVTATYSSKIHNAELNYLLGVGRVSFLAGLRYFELSESFDITSIDVQTGASQYDIDAINHLYGFQGGIRSNIQAGRFWFDFTAKGGVYRNAAEQHQVVDDFAGFVLRDAEADDDRVSFVGDIGVNMAYQISCNLWVRAGYNAMFVDGVALAPDQLDFTDTIDSGTEINNEKNVFYHGANIGVIVRR